MGKILNKTEASKKSKKPEQASEQDSTVTENVAKVYLEVYRNCKLGMENIKAAKPQVQDQSLIDLFNQQYKGYETLAKEVELKATVEDKQLEQPGILSKAWLWGEAFFNALKDKSASNFAELMIQGINSGIINLTRLQNQEKGQANNEILVKLMDQYQNNFTMLKSFL